jgi:phosphoglycolate phosphatase
VRQALTSLGEVVTADGVERVLAAYIEALKEEVPLVSDERYRVHPGMREAIELGLKSGAAVGLGTGNVRAGAEVKLGRVRLHESFSFGGFGSDAEERIEVLRIGAERGAAELGVPRSECRVVIIGDTPKDVAAAQGIGAECIGVATGSYTVESLLACGATAAFADLTAVGALAVLLASD